MLNQFQLLIWTSILIHSGAAQSAQRTFLNQNSAFHLQVPTDHAHLLCFKKPNVFEWISAWYKNFVVSIKPSDASFISSMAINPVFIYEGDLHRESGVDVTCSSLKSKSSSTGPLNVLSTILPYTSLTVRKISLGVDGFNWTVPGYSPLCIAICTPSASSSIWIQVHSAVHFAHLAMTAIGIICLFTSQLISTNITFYYFSGSGLVVCGSLLVVLLIFVRMLPFRRGGAVLQAAIVLLGGTFSFILLALDYARSSVLQFLADNAELTFVYTISVLVLSLLFFYWFHLPERLISNYPRTKTVMKYVLQLLGASLIVTSINLPLSDEELKFSILQCLPHYLYSAIILSPTRIQLVGRLSFKFLWLLCVFGIVLLVNVVEICYTRLSKSSSTEDFTITPNGHIGYADHFPGSPWACSSPFTNHVPGSTSVSRRLSSVDFHSPRALSSNGRRSLSEFPTLRQSCQLPRTHASTPPDDLLTDDESE